MKIRTGFVSNSSSSSFVVSKRFLSPYQIEQIYDYKEVAKDFFMDNIQHGDWYINETDEAIEFSTIMNNFNMREFLYNIGVGYGVQHEDS